MVIWNIKLNLENRMASVFNFTNITNIRDFLFIHNHYHYIEMIIFVFFLHVRLWIISFWSNSVKKHFEYCWDYRQRCSTLHCGKHATNLAPTSHLIFKVECQILIVEIWLIDKIEIIARLKVYVSFMKP